MTAPPRLSFPSSQVTGGANRAIVNRGWLTSAGAARAFWWAPHLTKSLNSVAEPCSPVSLESNCQRHKRGQQPEDSAIGRPTATVIICLCTSRRCARKGVLTSVVRLTDTEEKGPLLLQPLSDKTHDLRLSLWSVATGWQIALLACCQLYNWRSETRPLACRRKPEHYAMFCSVRKQAPVIVPLLRERSRLILCLSVHQENTLWHNRGSCVPINHTS